jgi:hypothetical protein
MSQKEYSVTDLCEVLRLAFAKNNQTFFGYAWREKLGEFLEEESRYAKLVEWLNKEIGRRGDMINVLSPANWSNEFETGYIENLKEFAVMVHTRDLLLDNRTTMEMRERIEKMLCNHYGIHYNEELESYV